MKRLVAATISASISLSLFLGSIADAQTLDGGKLGEGHATESRIEYIRPDIPPITIPAYEGLRYPSTVPRTLDLAERAGLAVQGLTGPTDPQADHKIYVWVEFFSSPPAMYHDWNDWCQAKFMEALPLMRIASGSGMNSQVDEAWMKMLLKSVGPDGLFYIPTERRPWSRILAAWADDVWRADGGSTKPDDPTVTQMAAPWYQGRLIGTATIYYLRDERSPWKEIIENNIDRLAELMIDKGEYGYFPGGVFEPNAKPPADAPMPVGMQATLVGWTIQGLAQYDRAVGHKPARDLARKLAYYLKDHSGNFDARGHYLDPNTGAIGGHFHHRAIAVLGLLEYGLVAQDQEIIEFVRKSYEWTKTQGHDLVGFFPENIVPDYKTSEICEVADMLALAVKLSQAGVGDYWDDVDRWARNQFAENQLTQSQCEYLTKIDRSGARPPGEVYGHDYLTTDRALERNIGAFAGWSSANEWALYRGIMHCCTGNGARALYYVWESIVDDDDGVLEVNLLLNRASPRVDVLSHIPYQGRVDLKIKQACRQVRVRAPQWIESGSDEVIVSTRTGELPFSWSGQYLDLGSAEAGATITVAFPIEERTVADTKIGDASYTLVLKGNTVVAIDPPGKVCPLYQREHYRGDKTLWKQASRFVSNNAIDW